MCRAQPCIKSRSNGLFCTAGMMSTGRAGFVHTSEQIVRSLTIPVWPLRVSSEPGSILLHHDAPFLKSDSRLAVTYRGLTTVKGKGDLPTYYLHRADAPVTVDSRAAEEAAFPLSRDCSNTLAVQQGHSQIILERHATQADSCVDVSLASDSVAHSILHSGSHNHRRAAAFDMSANLHSLETAPDSATASGTAEKNAQVACNSALARHGGVTIQGWISAVDNAAAASVGSTRDGGVSSSPEHSVGISAAERITRRAAQLSESVRSARFLKHASSPVATRSRSTPDSPESASALSRGRAFSRKKPRRSSGSLGFFESQQRQTSMPSGQGHQPSSATSRSDEARKAGLLEFDAAATTRSDYRPTLFDAVAPFAILAPRRLSVSCRESITRISQAYYTVDRQLGGRNSVVSDVDHAICAAQLPTIDSSASAIVASAEGVVPLGPAPSRPESVQTIDPTASIARRSSYLSNPQRCEQMHNHREPCSAVKIVDIVTLLADESCAEGSCRPIESDPNLQTTRTGNPCNGAMIDEPSSSSWRLRCGRCHSVRELWTGFENADTELEAQRALFLHAFKASSDVYPIWIVCLVVVVVGYATLSTDAVSSIRCVGYTSLPLVVFCALAITSRIISWTFRVSSVWNKTTMQATLWALTCVHICIVGLMLWVASGSDTAAVLAPSASMASSFGRDADSDPDYTLHGPFESQMLVCLIVSGYVQHVAHVRLPFLHTCVFAAATMVYSMCMAVPRLSLGSAPLAPSTFGFNVFAFFSGLAPSALTIVVSAFVWEGRCREQILRASATSAVQAAATNLLNNLMPPSIVDDMVSGREIRPALARNVVVLVRSMRSNFNEMCLHLTPPHASPSHQHADIVGFTALSGTLPPSQLMAHLNTIFR